MICQDLFSLKNKTKYLECCLLQILLGALRVNTVFISTGVVCVFALQADRQISATQPRGLATCSITDIVFFCSRSKNEPIPPPSPAPLHFLLGRICLFAIYGGRGLTNQEAAHSDLALKSSSPPPPPPPPKKKTL